MQAGAVDDLPGQQQHRLRAADLQDDALARDLGPLATGSRTRSWRRAARHRPGRPASGHGCRSPRSWATIALPCSGAPAPAHRACARTSARDPACPAAARCARMVSSVATCASLVATISLPQRTCATPALGAVAVEELLARDAEPRLQAARRVVDAGMDHLAVARAGLRADRIGALEDDHLEPGHRQPARAGEPDDARPRSRRSRRGPLPCSTAERPVELGVAQAQAGDGGPDIGEAACRRSALPRPARRSRARCSGSPGKQHLVEARVRAVTP